MLSSKQTLNDFWHYEAIIHHSHFFMVDPSCLFFTQKIKQSPDTKASDKNAKAHIGHPRWATETSRSLSNGRKRKAWHFYHLVQLNGVSSFSGNTKSMFSFEKYMLKLWLQREFEFHTFSWFQRWLFSKYLFANYCILSTNSTLLYLVCGGIGITLKK